MEDAGGGDAPATEPEQQDEQEEGEDLQRTQRLDDVLGGSDAGSAAGGGGGVDQEDAEEVKHLLQSEMSTRDAALLGGPSETEPSSELFSTTMRLQAEEDDALDTHGSGRGDDAPPLPEEDQQLARDGSGESVPSSRGGARPPKARRRPRETPDEVARKVSAFKSELPRMTFIAEPKALKDLKREGMLEAGAVPFEERMAEHETFRSSSPCFLARSSSSSAVPPPRRAARDSTADVVERMYNDIALRRSRASSSSAPVDEESRPERPVRPLPGGGGGGPDVREGPAPRSADEVRWAKEARAEDLMEAAAAKSQGWDDRHHLTFSNEINYRLPQRSGTGKILTALNARSYFDRMRENPEKKAPQRHGERPNVNTLLPMWRLEPMGVPWRQEAATAAARASFEWHANKAVQAAAAAAEAAARDAELEGGGESASPATSKFGPDGAAALRALAAEAPDLEKLPRDPTRPFMPGPGGGGSPHQRLLQPPPPGPPDNGRGLPLTAEDEVRRKRWQSRHDLSFKNEEVSRLDRSYFDRWREPEALLSSQRKMKGKVVPRSSSVWALAPDSSIRQEAKMVMASTEPRHQPMGKWNPRHGNTFCNDMQVNLRSYFDRWREPMEHDGAALSEADLVQKPPEERTYLDATQSHLRSKREKLMPEDKLAVDWSVSELWKKSPPAQRALRQPERSGSEGALLAAKLERQRYLDMIDRGRAREVEAMRKASLLAEKRERAWFSSHAIYF
eukprot:TRINITY_DN54356_c0_g1_i1.p1 TRINITY_DN54356_c0_g1~~TRINITY_DN54356_c0_g1_i1.p1  ORF type:complete len:736 (-),score=205.01 TRINITY_DN54356_c0_g1_i1:104-2311(-)